MKHFITIISIFIAVCVSGQTASPDDDFEFCKSDTLFIMDTVRNLTFIHQICCFVDGGDTAILDNIYFTSDSLFLCSIKYFYHTSIISEIECVDGKTNQYFKFDINGKLIKYGNYSYQLSNVKTLTLSNDSVRSINYVINPINRLNNGFIIDSLVTHRDTINTLTERLIDISHQTFYHFKYTEECIEIEWLKDGIKNVRRIKFPN